MTAAATLDLLRRWRADGTLRALDLAFATFLHELDPAAPGSLLAAAALLAHLEGRGHSCLPLADAARDAASWLDAPAAAASGLAELLQGWPADAAAARAAWGAATVLQADPADAHGDTPLVLAGDRLYLRRYWRHETEVAAAVRLRSRADAALPPDAARARALLDRLFGAPPAAGAAREPDWQKVACALALRGGLTLITGGPGTGKTWTAARLLVWLQALHAGPQPLRVALAAPTGKAASRLRQAIETALQGLRRDLPDLPALWAVPLGPARTLHALLGARPGTRRFRHDAANPLDLDLLFVDEASMVHLEMMAALFAALPPRARLVLLGDKDQLASVEAGAVLGDLCLRGSDATADATADTTGYTAATRHWVRAFSGEVLPDEGTAAAGTLAQQTVTLRSSRRFAGPIGELARCVNRGDGAAALALLRTPAAAEVVLVEQADAQPVLALALDGRAGAAGGYRAYLEAMARRPADPAAFEAWAVEVLRRFDDFRVLCALRDGPWGVAGLNTAIERALAAQGLLARRGEWYEGRPLMVTRNDPTLGVFNGDIGLVLRPPGAGPLRAWFLDGSVLRSVAVTRLATVETAFALTVHKSQGSEFAHVVLVLPDRDAAVLTRELVYTGITRARQALTVVTNDGARLAQACGRLTRRLSGLPALLQADADP